eukprot:2338946-Amphidinium_carterae.1
MAAGRSSSIPSPVLLPVPSTHPFLCLVRPRSRECFSLWMPAASFKLLELVVLLRLGVNCGGQVGRPCCCRLNPDTTPCPTSDDLAHMCSPKRVQEVWQRLKTRACADAAGWTQRVMAQLLAQASVLPIITE